MMKILSAHIDRITINLDQLIVHDDVALCVLCILPYLFVGALRYVGLVYSITDPRTPMFVNQREEAYQYKMRAWLIIRSCKVTQRNVQQGGERRGGHRATSLRTRNPMRLPSLLAAFDV